MLAGMLSGMLAGMVMLLIVYGAIKLLELICPYGPFGKSLSEWSDEERAQRAEEGHPIFIDTDPMQHTIRMNQLMERNKTLERLYREALTGQKVETPALTKTNSRALLEEQKRLHERIDELEHEARNVRDQHRRDTFRLRRDNDEMREKLKKYAGYAK